MKIKELFSSPEKWTKKDYALDANGVFVPPRDKSAVSWCLYGAVCKCYYPDRLGMISVIEKIKQRLDKSGAVWNDAPERTFEDVKRLAEALDI